MKYIIFAIIVILLLFISDKRATGTSFFVVFFQCLAVDIAMHCCHKCRCSRQATGVPRSLDWRLENRVRCQPGCQHHIGHVWSGLQWKYNGHDFHSQSCHRDHSTQGQKMQKVQGSLPPTSKRHELSSIRLFRNFSGFNCSCSINYHAVCNAFFQVPAADLCTEAKARPMHYLYRLRHATPNNECPTLLIKWGASFGVTYSEYLSEDGAYVKNCGQPRSELNSCFRKRPEDPQLTFNLGSCPDTALVHRMSLTQNVKCIATWHNDV